MDNGTGGIELQHKQWNISGTPAQGGRGIPAQVDRRSWSLILCLFYSIEVHNKSPGTIHVPFGRSRWFPFDSTRRAAFTLTVNGTGFSALQPQP